MHWFGKFVLIPFNLIVGGVFAYFAMQDYFGEKNKGNGRQATTAAGLRHILLVRGLPLGTDPNDPAAMPTDSDPNVEAEIEVPFKVEMAGGYKTTTVSTALLKSYFTGVGEGGQLGGGPVPNQLAEVKRVKAKLDDLLKADGADRATLLSSWLLLQAETLDERIEYQTLNADELQKRLDAKFAAVIDGPKPVGDDATSKLAEADADDSAKQQDKLKAIAASRVNVLDDGERRTRIAHLLVHLNPDAAWQKRVMSIIGMHKYVAVVAAQSERFREMTARVELLAIADQGPKLRVGKDTVFGGFLGQEADLQRQAINNTELANRQADLKKKWTDQKRKDDDFVGQRTTQLAAIKAQLVKVRAEVAELLQKQTGIETVLFEVQREVAITLDDVYRLEEILAARERDLLKLPPKPKAGN